jgi:hypothetical protein
MNPKTLIKFVHPVTFHGSQVGRQVEALDIAQSQKKSWVVQVDVKSRLLIIRVPLSNDAEPEYQNNVIPFENVRYWA